MDLCEDGEGLFFIIIILILLGVVFFLLFLKVTYITVV